MTKETKSILQLTIPLGIVLIALLIKKLRSDKYLKRAWWNFGDYNVVMAGVSGMAFIVWAMNVLMPEPMMDENNRISAADFPDYGTFSFQFISLPGLIAACSIFFTWYYFLQRVDVFEQKKKRQLLFSLFCIFIYPILITLVYSVLHKQLNYMNSQYDQLRIEDCIIGIGLVEESIKLIPFLLVLKFTKLIRHPIDYIIYGSLCGLSFSFVENLLYFNGSSGINSMSGRAIWCTVTHMFNTCIIAYTIMLAKHKWKKNFLPWLIPSLFIASIAHGLFDVFQIGIHHEPIWLGTFLILLSSIVIYVSMINNCLNNSPFQKYYQSINVSKTAAILCSALIGVITLKFMLMSILYGNKTGNYSLGDSLLGGWYLLIFLTVSISSIDVIENRWSRLKFFSSINPLILIMNKKINYSRYLGMKLVFNGARKDSKALAFLPINGRIHSRHVISDYSGWLLIELEKEILFKNQPHKYLLMCTREKNVPLTSSHNTPVGIFIVPQLQLLKEENPREEQLILLDWVLMN